MALACARKLASFFGGRLEVERREERKILQGEGSERKQHGFIFLFKQTTKRAGGVNTTKYKKNTIIFFHTCTQKKNLGQQKKKTDAPLLDLPLPPPQKK